LLFTSAALVAAAAPAAHAGIAVTSASISHTYTYDHTNPANEGTFVVLHSTTTGNAFTTFDGETGFTSTLDADNGEFRISVGGTTSNPQNAHLSSISGTVQFTVTAGTLTLLPGLLAGSQFGGNFTIRNIATSESWRYELNPSTGPSVTGALPLPAPAGSYEATFAGSTFRQTGVSSPGSLAIGLAVVPEPATLAALGFVGGIVRRRR
jgi:hypothetical protein